jgi:hypothetical protein
VLADVVTEGTAKAAALGPFTIAGKTGTSRSYIDGHYRSGAYASTFAGFFPVENPQLVFLVKLDSPRGDYYGGLTAAPVTRATLEAALAALNTPLDKRAVASNAPPPLTPVRFALSTPKSKTNRGVLVALKPPPSASRQPRSVVEPPTAVTLPDVTGIPLRDAVRQLHAAGFRVRVNGSGVVGSSKPLAGALLPRGALIRLGAAEAGS